MTGLTIDGKHTSEFGLKMLEFEVPPPDLKEIKQSVPGMDGDLDLSEALGCIRFKDRKLEAKFDLQASDSAEAMKKLSPLFNAVHGKKIKIVPDADPDFYYEGRVKIDYSQKNNLFYQIKLKGKVFPYKLKNALTVITTDIVGSAEVICKNLRMPIVPTVTCDTDFNLQFGEFSVQISAGTHVVPDLLFVEGENRIRCVGTGRISFSYQEGGF